MEEGVVEEALQQGRREPRHPPPTPPTATIRSRGNCKVCAWRDAGGSPSVHTILCTVTRRSPCIFNKTSLRCCLGKRKPAHLCAGALAGCC